MMKPRWRGSPERAQLFLIYREADALLESWQCACSAGSPTFRSELSLIAPDPSLRSGCGRPLRSSLRTGACEAGPRCCLFGVTGREPHPTAVEFEEVAHAMRGASVVVGDRALAADAAAKERTRTPLRPCPLLTREGRCSIYPSRPFGCRTFFCEGADSIDGQRKPPRAALQALGRRIADLSARFEPRDPLPRPLTRWLRMP